MRTSGILAFAFVVAMLPMPAAAKDPPPSPNIVSGVQIGVGACVTGDAPSGRGIFDSVMTALVSKGVNLIGNALTEAGKDKTWKALGSRNLPGGQAPFPKCVQLVRGRFRTDNQAGDTSWLEAIKAGAPAALLKNGIALADKPDFFFEGAIVTSEDKTAATVRPLFVVLYTAQGTKLIGGKDRSVVTFFSFSPPGTNPNLDSNPAATVVLGPMLPGQTLRYPVGTAQASTPYEASWFTLSEADARKPLTVTAMISETQSGSPFFAFLGSIFNDAGVKQAITDRANIIFVPSAGNAADATHATASRTAADTADTALADAISKLRICVGAGTDLGKAAEAKSSLRAYLAADAALPTPLKRIDDNVINSIDLTQPANVAGACNAVHQRLTGALVS